MSAISKKRDQKFEEKYSEEPQFYQGRWTDKEHQAFINAIRMYGKKWKLICSHVKTRSCTQIRSHAQKFFSKEDFDNIKPMETIQTSPLIPKLGAKVGCDQ
jgi:SHAQKYF class myb-like DNA-binding protein